MLPLKIAIKFITSNLTQALFIILGIGIGVMVQIFIGTLIDSLQQKLINDTTGNSPHIIIKPLEDKQFITEYEAIESKINTSNISAMQSTISYNVFLIKDTLSQPVIVKSVKNIQNYEQIYEISKNLKGNPPKNENEILIGKDTAEKFDLNINDEIKILTTQNQEKIMVISGIFDLKSAVINKQYAFTTFEAANYLMAFTQPTEIEIKVSNVFEADKIASQIENQINNREIKITNWKQENKQLLSALSSQSSSSLIIQIAVLASVVVAITSILSIKVMQKSKQIGILKAMGLKDVQSAKIFIWESFILGITGATIGTLLGLGMFKLFVTFAKSETGDQIVSEIYKYNYIFYTWLVAIIASTFAGLMPSYKTFKLTPIQIIRNE